VLALIMPAITKDLNVMSLPLVIRGAMLRLLSTTHGVSARVLQMPVMRSAVKYATIRW
jgi:hypothetical protein